MTKQQLSSLSSPESTRKYINLAFGVLIFVLLMAILISGSLFFKKIMWQEENRLSLITSEIIAKSVNKVSFSGKYHARLLLEEIKSEQKDIRYILIADRQGRILAHTNPQKNDQLLARREIEQLQKQIQTKQSVITRRINYQGEKLIENSLLYRGGYNNRILGVIRIALSTEFKNQAIQQTLYVLVAFIFILMILGMIATRYLGYLLIRPVKNLANNLAATLEAIPDLLFELDSDGRYLQVLSNTHNDALLIKARQQLLDKTVNEMMPADAAKVVMDALQEASLKHASYGRELCLDLKNGLHWFELSVSKMPAISEKQKEQEKDRFIVLSRDITRRKQDAEKITQLAHFDSLTGLYNRYSLEMRLEQALLDAKRYQFQLDIFFIDMDHFKNINDSLGHHVGDLFLKEIASRLQAAVRKSDVVGRLGGDEFIVLLNNIGSLQCLNELAIKILGVLSKPYYLETHQVYTTASMGISQFPDDGENIQDLMKHADIALYQAKENGRNTYQFFSSEITQKNEQRLQIEADLRRALQNDEFQLYYQPQICIRQERVCGAEALIRWFHPDKGMISPIEFIPVAEETGLIIDIGLWVIENCFKQLQQWQHSELADLVVSLNLSVHQLYNEDLLDNIQSLLQKYDISPARLEFEITESVAMQDPEKSIDVLKHIRAMGISLAIDDFGTGYSSLAYLKRLPIQTLKIDREFIRDIETDQNDAAICSATIALAHSLGLNVVAEGVENTIQKEFLLQQECDILQGYYYSKPVSADKMESFYQQFYQKQV